MDSFGTYFSSAFEHTAVCFQRGEVCTVVTRPLKKGNLNFSQELKYLRAKFDWNRYSALAVKV